MQIIYEIRDTVLHPKPVSHEKSLILALIDACDLYRIVCRDRQERKTCRRKIKELMKSDAISQGVSQAIKETHAAIVGAVVAATAGAAAASS